tara:strand:- start:801 stop:1148 length:348 start_codon:yes stop_codon:yes gene_type:complete
MIRNLVLFSILVFATSCATLYSGNVVPSAINQGNFKVITPNAQGESSASYFLIILGSVEPNGLYANAMRDLKERFPIKEGQILTNITVDEKRKYILPPLIYIKTILITGDIVEFK